MKVLVLGAGDVGLHFIRFCEQENIDLAIIDKNKELLEPFKKKYSVYCEDFHSTTIFTKEFLKDVDLFFSVTDSDETNLIACQLISKLGVEHTVCRHQYLNFKGVAESLNTGVGSYRFINPSVLLANEVLRNIETPNSAEQLLFFNNQLVLIGFHILESCKLESRPFYFYIKQFQKQSIVPVGIYRRDTFFPYKETLTPTIGDIAYFICQKKQIKDLRKILGYYYNKRQNITIAGGGQNSYYLIQAINKSSFNMHLSVVEENKKNCQYLMEKFNNVAVLNFSVTNKKEMLEERLDNTDIFVAINDDSAQNITSCFLAKELAVKNLICATNYGLYRNLSHNFIFHNIRLVCSHLLTARFLSHLLYSKKILKYFTIKNSSTEFLEILIDYPPLQGHRFDEMPFPTSFCFHAFYRNNKIFFAKEDYYFQLGDVILISILKRDRDQVLKQLKF